MAIFSAFKNQLTSKTPSTYTKLISYKRLAILAVAASAFAAVVQPTAVSAATLPAAATIVIHSSLRTLDPILKPVSSLALSGPVHKNTDDNSSSADADKPEPVSALAILPVEPNPIQVNPLAAAPTLAIADTTVTPVAAEAPRIDSAPGTSYPWANTPFPNSIPDTWGMYQRQCVSYTAWKVASSGRTMPNWAGRGDAKLWDDNAIADGIPVDTTPRVGDIAVDNSGPYGHTMYVEAVNPDGTIHVSQYNVAWDGEYSEETNRSTAGLVFIHF